MEKNLTNKKLAENFKRLIERLILAHSYFQVWEAIRELRAPNKVGKNLSETNSKILNQFGNFFWITSEANRKTFALELYKFFEKSNESLSLQKFINFIRSNRKIIKKEIDEKKLKEFESFFEQKKDSIKRLKIFRDQDLAHDQIKKNKNSISVSEFEKLFDFVDEVLVFFNDKLNFCIGSHLDKSENNCAKLETKMVIEYLQKYFILKREFRKNNLLIKKTKTKTTNFNF